MKKKNMYIVIIIAVLVIIIAGVIAICVLKKSNKNDNKNEITTNDSSVDTTLSDESQEDSSDVDNTATKDEEVKKDYDQNATFTFSVSNYTKNGSDASVSGIIEGGTLKAGENVKLIGKDLSSGTAVVSEIKKSGENVDSAVAGDKIEITLKSVSDSDIKEVSEIIKHGEVRNISKCQIKVYVLTAAEGGRSTPLFHNFRNKFTFENGSEAMGVIKLPLDEGVEMVNPGESAIVELDLEQAIRAEDNATFLVYYSSHNKTVINRGIIQKVLE